MKIDGALNPIDGSTIQGSVSARGRADVRLIDIYFDNRLVRTLQAVADSSWRALFGLRRQYRFETQLAPQTIPRLPATVKVNVKDRATGIELKGSPAFLEGNEAIAEGTPIQNDKGEFFVLNKNGVLTVQYGDRSPKHRRGSVENAGAIIELFEELGFRACLAYGGLLGAVRNGRLIDHDDDVDIMFIANGRSLQGAVADFNTALNRAAERKLRVKGFSVGQAHIFVSKNDFESAIDIFLGWIDEQNNVFLNFAIAGTISADRVFPLGTIELEGVSIKAPKDPVAFCETLYGPGWRTPDPFFRWPDRIDSRTRALFAPIASPIDRRSWWNRHFTRMRNETQKPTWEISAQEDLKTEKSAILVGCGVGDQAIELAKAGYTVIAYEYAARAAVEARKTAAALRLANCRFRAIDIRDLRKHPELSMPIRRQPIPRAMLATVALDAYRKEDLAAFAAFSRHCLRRGEKLILEILDETSDLHDRPKLHIDELVSGFVGFEILSQPADKAELGRNAPGKIVLRRTGGPKVRKHGGA